MKKITKVFTLAIALFSLCSYAQFKDINISGKWEDKEMKVEYNFSTKDKAYFSQMGYGMPLSYKVDITKSPYWIDFTIERGGNKIKIPGLLRIIDKDTIWIEQFPPYSKHTTEFSEDFKSKSRKIHVLVRNE